jgi:hypothetical protein
MFSASRVMPQAVALRIDAVAVCVAPGVKHAIVDQPLRIPA